MGAPSSRERRLEGRGVMQTAIESLGTGGGIRRGMEAAGWIVCLKFSSRGLQVE